MSRFVTEAEINYRQVIRRGGTSGGDENFAFVRCPSCGQIYLIDHEVDTAYLDANDLSRRVPFHSPGDAIACAQCGEPLLAEQIWAAIRGDTGTLDWQVPWEQFQGSGWAWAARPGGGLMRDMKGWQGKFRQQMVWYAAVFALLALAGVAQTWLLWPKTLSALHEHPAHMALGLVGQVASVVVCVGMAVLCLQIRKGMGAREGQGGAKAGRARKWMEPCAERQ